MTAVRKCDFPGMEARKWQIVSCSGWPATAKVGGRPIHPMLVPFPIALLGATFLCDLVYLATGNPFWAAVSVWSLYAAIQWPPQRRLLV
ncbi:DUF2231 domain-containing protein [Ensifer aridi]|uniref:DUF2231 domain-containing protein n=1 Tax=Ensifer aridi TaxID=1708715 RepID=UPI0011116D33